jgi:hypothetical protein
MKDALNFLLFIVTLILTVGSLAMGVAAASCFLSNCFKDAVKCTALATVLIAGAAGFFNLLIDGIS